MQVLGVTSNLHLILAAHLPTDSVGFFVTVAFLKPVRA